MLKFEEVINDSNMMRLYECISAYSEEMYSAGWLVDIEYIVWLKFREELPSGSYAAKLLEEAFELSLLCSGWWVYDDTKGKCFVTLSEWGELFRNWEITR